MCSYLTAQEIHIRCWPSFSVWTHQSYWRSSVWRAPRTCIRSHD